MKIFVRAKPNAHEERVEKLDDVNYAVSVKEPPVDGRANLAVMRAIAAYFGVPIITVRIISGHTNRQKVVEIAGL